MIGRLRFRSQCTAFRAGAQGKIVRIHKELFEIRLQLCYIAAAART